MRARRGIAIVAVVMGWASVASAQVAVDEIAPQSVTWHGSAAVGTWPITARLDGMEWRPGAGLIPRYSTGALDGWPDGTPAGWDGPLQFTLWACVQIPTWHCGGFMLFWRGRESTGAHWLEPAPAGPQAGTNNWQANWADKFSPTGYPPMSAYVPSEGDDVAFFLAAGGNRTSEVFTVAARTQIIKVKVRRQGVEWASNVSGQPPPVVIPPPGGGQPPPVVVQPPPVVVPPDVATHADTQRLYEQAERIFADITKQQAALGAQLQKHDDEPGWLTKVLGNRYVQLAMAGFGAYVARWQMTQ